MSLATAETLPRYLKLSAARWARPAVATRVTPGQRRMSIVWGLLLFNVLEYSAIPTIVPLASTPAKIVVELSLFAALILALSLNRQIMVRPNVYLALLSLLAVAAFAMSIRGYFGLGSTIRAVRLLTFLSTLWLTTPWWDRSDLLIARLHLRWLAVVLGSVVLGLIANPGGAFYAGRLDGSVWPIPPPQVAHYAAVTVGVSVVLWFTGVLSTRRTVLAAAIGTTILLMTRTRTALLSMVVGLIVASASLAVANRRVRRVLVVAAAVVGIVALTALPVVVVFLARGQNAQELSDLTGRANVWQALISAPRSVSHEVFGFGLSNKSFNGLPVDSNWLATYQDEGLFGDTIDGVILLSLFAFAWAKPSGVTRAVPLFLVTYCLVASFTEVGLGDASPYLLDLTVAASLIATRSPGWDSS